HPDLVAVDDATRQDEPVEVLGACLGDRHVGVLLVALLAGDALLGRDEHRLRARRRHRLPRGGQLGVLVTVRREERDTLAVQVSHPGLPSLVWALLPRARTAGPGRAPRPCRGVRQSVLESVLDLLAGLLEVGLGLVGLAL